MRIGMPAASAYPIAAQTPESGIGTMTSASHAAIRAPAVRPKLRAHFVDALAEHVAVGPREIDVLEDALRAAAPTRNGLIERRPLRARDHDLARLDIANIGRADEIHRAGFGADDPGVAQPAERQRPEPMRIAHPDQPILRHHDERERAAHLRQGVDDRGLGAALRERANRWTMTSVSVVGLENRTGPDERVAQLAGIDQVAVVADRQLPVRRCRSTIGWALAMRLSPAVE